MWYALDLLSHSAGNNVCILAWSCMHILYDNNKFSDIPMHENTNMDVDFAMRKLHPPSHFSNLAHETQASWVRSP